MGNCKSDNRMFSYGDHRTTSNKVVCLRSKHSSNVLYLVFYGYFNLIDHVSFYKSCHLSVISDIYPSNTMVLKISNLNDTIDCLYAVKASMMLSGSISMYFNSDIWSNNDYTA